MFVEPQWRTPRYVLDGDLFDASAQYWLSEVIIFSVGETRYAAPVRNEKLFIAGDINSGESMRGFIEKLL
jgi:hypothetical protein